MRYAIVLLSFLQMVLARNLAYGGAEVSMLMLQMSEAPWLSREESSYSFLYILRLRLMYLLGAGLVFLLLLLLSLQDSRLGSVATILVCYVFPIPFVLYMAYVSYQRISPPFGRRKVKVHGD